MNTCLTCKWWTCGYCDAIKTAAVENVPHAGAVNSAAMILEHGASTSYAKLSTTADFGCRLHQTLFAALELENGN